MYAYLILGWAWEMGSRDSSVGIATSYGLDDRSFIHDGGKRFFSTPQSPDLLSGSYPMHTGGPFAPGVKRPGPEAMLPLR
jgi:hypothetical protein